MDKVTNGYQVDLENILEEDLPWDKLNGKNILVAGATGLIGSCLVDALLLNTKAGCNVFAMGRNQERAWKLFEKHAANPRFKFLKGDISEPIDSTVDFHYIIDAASNASPNFFAQKPVEVMKSNLYGVVNLAEYGIAHNMQRMLYVSTGEIYGENTGRQFAETDSGYVDCAQPRACYPSSKRAAETLCASYAAEYGTDIVIARPCHVYGPHYTEADNRVYAQFIRNIINNEDILMKSAGTQLRSWCYVVDCVKALLYILLKGEKGQPYNVADTDSCITIRQLAEMVAAIGGKKVLIQTDVESVDNQIITKALFDTRKLEGLGWRVRGDMKSKLQATIEEQIRYEGREQ